MTSLVELRVLEGPNLYFPRAAIKLTLDVTGLAAASEQDLRAFGSRARHDRRCVPGGPTAASGSGS